MLNTSKKIDKLARTQEALRRGDLSASQAECVADAASHNRDAEEHLLATARTSSLGELRDECARRKAAADPNPDATYRRIHEGRFCRQRRDPEGGWCLTARGTPDAGAAFNAALGPIIDEIFHTAWAQGRREAREQYAFDALIELARRARNGHRSDTDTDPGQAPETHRAHNGAGTASRDTDAVEPNDVESGGSDREPGLFGAANNGHNDAPAEANNDMSQTDDTNPPGSRSASKRHRRRRRKRRADSPTYLALLRIDFAALQRGHVEGDEICEIAGIGPIPVNRARELLSDAVIKLIATRGEQVANVTHYGRKPTTAQRMALLWSQPTCSVARCDHSIVQIEYRDDWHKTHRTRLEALDPLSARPTARLCPHHHRLKTHHGWALVAGTGKRPMVPPGDPRHPDNRRRRAPAPPADLEAAATTRAASATAPSAP